MQEKAHVLHILDLLKNAYEKNSPEEHPLRLPAYATLHLAHALRERVEGREAVVLGHVAAPADEVAASRVDLD